MSAKDEADADGVIQVDTQDFIALLRQLNFGDVANKLSDAHNECLREAKRLGRAASLKLELTYKPTKNDQFELYPKVTNTVPKEEMGADIMYLGKKGLQREHPRQRELEGIRSVPTEQRQVRSEEDTEPRVVRTA